MRTARVIIETINALALGVWGGSLAMAGVAAATVFPNMKRLGPTIPDFASPEDEHWRIVAGTMARSMFAVTQLVGMYAVLAIVTAVLLLWLFRWMSWQRPWTEFRNWACAVLVAFAVYVNQTLMQPMLNLFSAHTTFARAGDEEGSQRATDRFNELHDLASPLLGTLMLIIVLYLAVCIWYATNPNRREETGTSTP